ncbi:MAG: alkaline phosphatase family protein [Myxococcota bacterium]
MLLAATAAIACSEEPQCDGCTPIDASSASDARESATDAGALPDAEAVDLGSETDAGAGSPDATEADSGSADSGSTDSGSADSGSADAGFLDATSPVDAGPAADAGSTDAGTASDAGMGGCGACPAGTTCGTANGTPVCRTADGIPRFTHVFVIVMENTSEDTLQMSTNTPYIHGLISAWSSASDYHGVTHPSMPNYLAMTSNVDTSGIHCDCQPTGGTCNALNCNLISGNCGCPQMAQHLGDQLEAAGLSWKDYGEDMGSPCNTSIAGDYAPKHVPFLYYDNVLSNSARCNAHVVDYSNFAGDLSAPATYSLIAPNLVHDMHNPITGGATNLANGEAWLSTNVPPILASSAYTSGGLLVIVWDEDDLSGILRPDDPIPMILISPYAKHGGFVSAIHADHKALLATIEDGLGLPRLGSASTAPLADYFPAN